MSNSRTYTGITQNIFDCVKVTSTRDHGTVYTPANGNSGTSTTTGTGWTVKMTFDFNPSTAVLLYTITNKTWIVPESSIWSGIDATVDGCR